jgi:uncharacterized lipoprotein YmbA
MNIRLRTSGLLVVISLAILCAGCIGRSPRVTYYTLSPVAHEGAARPEELAIAVGPAEFPRALDRPEIATRISPNQVEYNEYRRWAGTLTADFLTVAATNLGRLLGTDRIVVYPVPPSFEVDYRVLFDVVRFDAEAAGAVILEVRWTLLSGNTGKALDVGSFATTETADADDYEARAAAHSEAIAALCREIADRIRRLPTGG